jgi:hypothetical protein
MMFGCFVYINNSYTVNNAFYLFLPETPIFNMLCDLNRLKFQIQ